MFTAPHHSYSGWLSLRVRPELFRGTHTFHHRIPLRTPPPLHHYIVKGRRVRRRIQWLTDGSNHFITYILYDIYAHTHSKPPSPPLNTTTANYWYILVLLYICRRSVQRRRTDQSATMISTEKKRRKEKKREMLRKKEERNRFVYDVPENIFNKSLRSISS